MSTFLYSYDFLDSYVGRVIMLKSLKVANYKNIGDSFVGFDNIEKFNILIGRNNIGKSILLSVLHKLKNIYFHNDRVEIFDDSTLIEYSIRINDIPRELFESDRPIGGFENYQAYGKSLLNKTIVYEYHMMDRLSHIKTFDDSLNKPLDTQAIDNDIKKLLEDLGQYTLKSFTNNFNLIKLNADRNLLPEKKSTNLKIDANGSGATNFIRTYLHNSKYDFKVVEKEMLEALNKIVLPDEHFDRIMCQEINSGDETKWEIHLVNENGRIPLSSSGSGLRTILLVLIKLFLEASKSQKNIFIFEELENNLHPTIQRNLFNYLYNWSIEKNDIFFITTHSNIPINMFGNMPSISITHLKKDRSNNELKTESAFSFSSNCDILNDIGVKASDILQSNGIIWVEGPSDRVYINKWIELASDGILKENIHYQILFYGGRLLAHLSGKNRYEDESELINLFLANRNSILVMDSDKKNQNSKINQTKKRIQKEFKDSGSFVWVTKGREIENYLSQRVINIEYGINKQIEQYQNIGEFLNNTQKSSKFGDNYIHNKYKKSVALVSHMKHEDLDILDLEDKINQIVKRIKDWNHIT